MLHTSYIWQLKTKTLSRTSIPLIMGILNVTPDSFSDGGSYLDISRAIDHAQQLVAEGADILDIGGESTRPGSTPVSLEDELQRTIPLVEALQGKISIPISIDTTKSVVAKAALERGVEIINDISGLTFDPMMAEVCAQHQCGIVCMHIQGTPQTMQLNPSYDNCVQEIKDWLEARMKHLTSIGINFKNILLDPGIGFGKTAEHNLEILSAISEFHKLKRPILIGHSRKRFLGKILTRPLDERLMGTIGVSLAISQLGCDIIRVHDVQANRDALIAFNTVVSGTNSTMPY